MVSDEDSIAYATSGGFPQRLTRLVGSSSVRGFARRANVSDTFLRQCLAGRTEPTRTKLIALAAAGGCSVEWLATGNAPAAGIAEGPDTASRDSRLDHSLLEAIVASIEEVLAENGHTVTPERKALLITALYDRHIGQDRPSVSRDQILHLLSHHE